MISNASLVDPVSGESAIRTIGVRDGIIAFVGDEDIRGVVKMKADGLWAVPGLWDMHAHISDASFFSLFLASGVVGVRDMGGAVDRATDGCESVSIVALKAWRDEIESGERSGPRLILAGPVASGTDWPTSLSAATPASAREAVRVIDEAGSDFVKVYENIPSPAFLALSSEAKNRGLNVAGHVSEETLTIEEAINAGQRSIEHVRANLLLCFARTDKELETLFAADEWNADDRAWAERHIAACPNVWSGFRNRDVWLTPTLAVQETLITGESTGFEDDPRRATLPITIRQAVTERSGRLRQRDKAEREAAAIWNKYIFRLVARARAEQTKFLAGSDAACDGVIPGFGIHRELQLLVDAGLSTLQALQAATIEAGRYLNKEHEIGRIAKGYNADIILIRGDPLKDISNLEDIETVIIRGDLVHSVE